VVPERSTASPDVSVVLALYNEAGHLEQEIKRIAQALDASDYSFEIIVVDDGSTDGSAELLAAITGIRFLRLGRNHGAGYARRVGTLEARGRVVVWTDVDMTYPNDEIPLLVDALADYDQVVGARRSEQGRAKALRVPAKWAIRKLASYLTATRIPDLNSGLRAFRRDVALQYLHLLPDGFSCVSTITLCFLSNGYSVRYVPIDYYPRAGRSKFRPIKDTQRYVTQVVRMVLTYNPLKVFAPLAAALFAIGTVKLGVDLFQKDWRVATNTLLILFTAFQLLAIGLIADLIVRLTRRAQDVEPAAEHFSPPDRGVAGGPVRLLGQEAPPSASLGG
jgi:glycosyltransferase involved in cell wall biosynthesis